MSRERVKCEEKRVTSPQPSREPSPTPKPPMAGPAASPEWSDPRCAAFDKKTALAKGKWCGEKDTSKDACEQHYVVGNHDTKLACVFEAGRCLMSRERVKCEEKRVTSPQPS